MEIIGRIIAVLPERSGVSARSGSEWRLGSYVLETVGDRYPRKMNFEVFGADKIQQFNIQVGEMVRVSFDIDAREFTRNDGTTTWFNSIRAWNVDRNVEAAPVAAQPVQQPSVVPFGSQPQQTAPAPTASEASYAAGGDDLPF